jgi:hypothetical protein
VNIPTRGKKAHRKKRQKNGRKRFKRRENFISPTQRQIYIMYEIIRVSLFMAEGPKKKEHYSGKLGEFSYANTASRKSCIAVRVFAGRKHTHRHTHQDGTLIEETDNRKSVWKIYHEKRTAGPVGGNQTKMNKKPPLFIHLYLELY